MKLGTIDVQTYLDVVNLDKYNMILGTVFMVKKITVLCMRAKIIEVPGTLQIPALKEGEGDTVQPLFPDKRRE